MLFSKRVVFFVPIAEANVHKMSALVKKIRVFALALKYFLVFGDDWKFAWEYAKALVYNFKKL